MGLRDALERAHHSIDLAQIHAQPLGPADGVDFVRVEEGRVYMRVVADNQIVATFRVYDHRELRSMAANMVDVADRMERLERRGRRGP